VCRCLLKCYSPFWFKRQSSWLVASARLSQIPGERKGERETQCILISTMDNALLMAGEALGSFIMN
jgi:hypothetical protein